MTADGLAPCDLRAVGEPLEPLLRGSSRKAREFRPDVVTISSVGNMLQVWRRLCGDRSCVSCNLQAFGQWEQAMLLAKTPHRGQVLEQRSLSQHDSTLQTMISRI